MRTHILIVEDDKEIAALVKVCLENEGYEVSCCEKGGQALSFIQKTPLDLAILDVMLPEMSGLEICKKIREQYFFPIIMLTARNEDQDKIMGLTLGADDYMTKPFNPLELVARVKTQLRRYQRYNQRKEPKSYIHDIRGLIIDNKRHVCHLYGQEILLTPLEFSILWYLAERRGQVVSSEALFEGVWQEKYLDQNNTVMAHIGRLREKLQDSSKQPKFIKTVWGVGYKIE